MPLIFEQIRAGGDRNFGYLLGDRHAGRGVLIDPSFAPEVFVQRAVEQQLSISHVINTHSHPDHTNGNAAALSLTGAPLTAHTDSPSGPDIRVADGQEISVGSLRLRFLHVPGHCADHVVIFEPAFQILITGDLLFVGKVGGTATEEDSRTEWASLQRVINAIPEPATMWPGHDYGVRPSSTMGLEKQTNPFLLCPDLAAFLELKTTWAEVKKRYGLK